MNKKVMNSISDEILAAYLDGNATIEESQSVLTALSGNAGLREVLRISQLVDSELELVPRECEYIPMTAMAASCKEGAYCCLECEKYILNSFGIEFDDQQLFADAVSNGWYKEEGTALHNVGRHLEKNGLIVTRRYKASIDDIIKALNENNRVIAAVDGGELSGNRIEELKEDILEGPIPDHTVVVLSVDESSKTICLHDPDSENPEDTYPLSIFNDAWNDSLNYMAAVSANRNIVYDPKPIDLSDVELTEELNELREAIAENAHDVWAVERKAQGWTYGPQRDDAKKETPCMVAYSQLPDSEKKFDRDMAMNTLKLVKKLGYDLIKREETELYQVLKKRIQDSEEEFFCRKCGNPIYRHQIFCDKCGLELKMDWE